MQQNNFDPIIAVAAMTHFVILIDDSAMHTNNGQVGIWYMERLTIKFSLH